MRTSCPSPAVAANLCASPITTFPMLWAMTQTLLPLYPSGASGNPFSAKAEFHAVYSPSS